MTGYREIPESGTANQFNVTNLSESTTYYVDANVVNNRGTARSTQANFTTYGKKITNNFSIVNNVVSGTNTATLTKMGTAPDITIEYSLDNTNWNVWNPDGNGVRTVTIPSNGRLYLRGNNPNGFCPSNTDANSYRFTCANKYALAGDIRSLISHYESDNLPAGAFASLFNGSTTLDNASYLRLHALKPGIRAYAFMFYGCTSLRLAPHIIPVTNFVNSNNSDGRCCTSMFYGCTSLTTMPIISATGFGSQTCYEMFRGCTALTKQWATDNPSDSTTRKIQFNISSDNGQTHTFYGMFHGCANLIDASGITATKTTDWHTSVFYNMFYDCSSLKSAPNITLGSFASDTKYHCQQMFYNCKKLTSVPNIQLTATTVYQQTYKNMFRGCTRLQTAPEIFATTLYADQNNGSLAGMFYGCSSLNYIRVYFTDWNDGLYTNSWTQGVPETGNFIKPSELATTKNPYGNGSGSHYIPYGWNVYTQPLLPVPTINDGNSQPVDSNKLKRTFTLTMDGYSGVRYRVAFDTFLSSPSCSYPIEELDDRGWFSGEGENSKVEITIIYSAQQYWMIKVIAAKKGYSPNENCRTGGN